MKNTKRKSIWCIVLVMLLLINNVLVIEAKYYDDVQVLDIKYRDAVNYVSDNEYMVGNSNTTFLPEQYMTRAMVVTTLYNMAGRPACNNTISFIDVAPDAWYYDPVRWAYDNGITSGKPGNLFDPNSEITRDQFAIFLWNYAEYKGDSIEITNETDITKVADYSEIPSYSINAMQWAVDKKIYTIDNETSELNPGGGIERKEVALAIVMYGEFVEGIVFGRDTFSFTNATRNFKNDAITGCYISDEDWSKMREMVYEAVYSLPANKRVNPESIYNNMKTSSQWWFGSCYGMSMVVILDKIGKIGFNENLSNATKTMYEVSIPIEDMEVMSRINFYQMSQKIPQIKDNVYIYKQGELSQGYKKLIEEVKENGIVQLGYYSVSEAHSIVLYKCTVNEEGNYVLWAYNPNCMEEQEYIISKDYSWSTFSTTKIKKISFRSDFSDFDLCDYDEEYNNMYSGEIEEKAAMLIIPLNQGNFVLSNAEGEKTCYNSDDMTFQGNMEIIDTEFTMDELMIYVKDSDNFMIESEEAICEFDILGQDVYAHISGTNIQDISVFSNGVVQMNGTSMDYLVIVDAYNDNYGRITSIDSCSETVVINRMK